MRNPFRYFNTSPAVIRLAVMMYVRFPLSLRQVEDLLHERGIDICHETVRAWWNRFGPMFAAEIRKRRIHHRSFSQWRWHLDEVFVKINGETHYLWRAVDHEGEVLESFVTKKRNRKAALRFLKKVMKRFGLIEQPCVRSAMRLAMRPAAGSTIGQNSHTNPSGDGRRRWRNSEALPHFRNSRRSMRRSTTISIANVISIAETFSSRTVLLLCSTGGSSVLIET